MNSVKSYIYLKVRLLFDPPLNSSIIEAIQQSIRELEWRLNVQVADGSYTSAGKRRYLSDKTRGIKNESAKAKAIQKYSKKWNNNSQVKKYRSSSSDAKKANQIKNKKLYQMSNQDLKTLNYRQQLEYQYKQNNKSKAAKVLAGVGAVAGAIGTINTLYKNSNNLRRNAGPLIEKGKKAVVSAEIVRRLKFSKLK